MRVRFSIGLLVLGLLVRCNGGGPTAPRNSIEAPTTPVVTQPPPPELTPTPPHNPCRININCGY
jgi:hypothetical protein